MRLGIDIGGTFTDAVAIWPDGRVEVHKCLSTPHDYAAGIIESVRALRESKDWTTDGDGEVVHGTTVATNAILAGTGARTGLITTEGFRDVLEIGRLRAPKLYDWTWQKPPPLVPRERRMEVTGRVARDGSVRTPLDLGSVKDAIRRRAEEGAAVIISSLLLELVEALCDSILIISEGRQLARGPISDIKEKQKADATLEEVLFLITGESPGAEPP